MKNDVLFSIIVPVHNVEAFLDDCIQSVRNQSYTNWELILINDGSTDRSGEICDKWSELDIRIHVEHQPQRGVSYSRNRGIELAKGDCLTFLDSDDLYHKDFIKSMYGIMQEYDVDIVQCGFSRFKEETTPLVQQKIESTSVELLDATKMNECIYTSGLVDYTVVWNKIYKRHIFEKHRFPINRIHEDTFISFKLYYLANQVAVITPKLYFYRYRKSSIMTSKVSEKNIDMLDAFEERLNYYKSIQDNKLYYLCLQKYMYSSIVLYGKSIRNKKSEALSKIFYERAKEVYNKMKRNPKACSNSEMLKVSIFIKAPKLYSTISRIIEIGKRVKNKCNTLLLKIKFRTRR